MPRGISTQVLGGFKTGMDRQTKRGGKDGAQRLYTLENAYLNERGDAVPRPGLQHVANVAHSTGLYGWQGQLHVFHGEADYVDPGNPLVAGHWVRYPLTSPADLAIAGDLPGGPVGQVVSYQYVISGGVPPYAVTLSAGSLPAGLSMDANGLVTGTRTTSGSASWTVRVVDTDETVVTLSDNDITISPTTLDPATLGNDGGTGGMIAADNLTITKNTDANAFSIGARVYSSASKTSGKYYFEATVLTAATRAENRGMDVGLENSARFTFVQKSGIGNSTLELSSQGSFYQNGSSNPGGPAYNAAGATVGVAVDLGTGKWWWRNASGWNPGGDPATGASPMGTLSAVAMTGGVVPFVTAYASNGSIRANFGNAPFVLGAVPAGFNPGWPQ